MGNVYSLKCEELRLELAVGKNGRLYAGVDKKGRDCHETLAKFMSVCQGKEMVYCSETSNNGPIDDVKCAEFDPDRDYDWCPVTDGELADGDGGWVKATPEQLRTIAEGVVKGTLGYIHGVTIITDAFRKD